MTNSALKAAITSTRGTLRSREQTALQTLAALWARCKAAIMDLLTRFLEAMKAARKQAGGTLAFFWLIEKSRLAQLKQALRDVITRYVALVDALASQVAYDATVLGNTAAAEMLAALGIDTSATVPLNGRPTTLMWLVDKIVEAVGRIMLLTVEDKQVTVEASLERAIDELGWRGVSLIVTVWYECYRAALISLFALAGLGWIWRAIHDRRECAYCKKMDGSLHPAGEQMQSHNNCRCECEPIALVQYMLSA